LTAELKPRFKVTRFVDFTNQSRRSSPKGHDARKGLAILSLSKVEPITHLADREGVSRQVLYRQKQKAAEALDEAFAAKDDGVLFYLPVTEAWLNQPSVPMMMRQTPARSLPLGA